MGSPITIAAEMFAYAESYGKLTALTARFFGC